MVGGSKINYKKKKVVISTHVYTTGGSQSLRDFLVSQKVSRLLFIGHPLFYDKSLDGSGYDLFVKGKKVLTRYGNIKRRFKLYEYFVHVLLNIYYVAITRQKWDLYVGSDNLNAFSGLILRRLSLVKKVVYYTIDYNPQRFDSKFENLLYHFVDRFCVRHCNETWNVSPRMESARSAYFSLKGGKQKVVPMGVWIKRIKVKKIEDIRPNTLVFMGHLTKKQGIGHVISAVPMIKKQLPNFKFVIVGDGPHKEALEQRVAELRIKKHVDFVGYVQSHEDIENILSECSAGIALYDRTVDEGLVSFTYFADPSKLKVYLACGLPVLVTDVPYNATELERLGCAKIVTNDPKSLSTGILEVMRGLASYRKNVLKVRDGYNWELIFPKALEGVI